jgi:prepilin-type N-terminal cleavage/methylation domain-containing protein
MKSVQVAFTLIETLVVVTIFGIMAALIVPRLARQQPQAEWSTILNDLNDIVYFTRQEAISSQRTCRLTFQTNSDKADSITIEEETDDPEKPGKKIYTQISSLLFNTNYIFHESIKIRGLYHGKTENLIENKGTGYCYFIPDGLVEDVTISFIRKERNIESPASFTMLPFLGKFQHKESNTHSES